MRRRCSSKTSSGGTIRSIPTTSAGDLPDSTLLPLYTRNQPGLHELFAELRAFVDRYPGDRVLLGEFYVPIEELVSFYGTRSPELHLPLNLTLTYSKWEPSVIGRTIAEYQGRVSGRGWPTTTFDTHDQLRIVARAGLRQARVAALLLLTQRGTPTVYYGDEIGMRGVAIPPEQAVDPQGRRTGRNRDPTPHADAMEQRAAGGFLDRRAVVAGRARPRRRERGEPEPRCRLAADAVPAPARAAGRRARFAGRCARGAHRGPGSRCLSADAAPRGGCSSSLNFTHERTRFALGDDAPGRVLLSSFLDREGERVSDQVTLRGDEGLLLALD